MRTLFTETLPRISFFVAPIFFLIIAGYGSYYIHNQKIAYQALEQKITEQQEFTASTTQALAESIQLIEKNLIETQATNQHLSQNISTEQQIIALIAQDLQKVTGTVGALDKLRRIDPELLQKYSKVYFLNEHYLPSSLSEINPEYLYDSKASKKFHTNVLPHLTKMMNDARTASTTIAIQSAYRSFADQSSIKTTYSVIYGSGANKFSADQGYSEHQLGTTVDFTTKELKGKLDGFDKTPSFAWLKENAHKYGFILSYPENNTYYVYEPWHWRYVGVELATKLKNEGKQFYEEDQRAIDNFLLNFFD